MALHAVAPLTSGGHAAIPARIRGQAGATSWVSMSHPKGGEEQMSFIAKAADSLLSAIVPHATAEAWTCPNGCHRVNCYCEGHIRYNKCLNNVGGAVCHGYNCRTTVYSC